MKHSNLGLLALSLLLSACASGYEKRQDAFKSSIEYPAIVPVTTARPSVSVKPPHRAEAHATSLWSSSPKSLFGDRRASAEGDILTVTIEIDDEAQLNTSSNTTRGNDRNFSLGSFFGLPEALNPVLPGGATLSPGLDVSGSRNTTGGGELYPR
jgi:flagellar L-ring protein precursor FlgH